MSSAPDSSKSPQPEFSLPSEPRIVGLVSGDNLAIELSRIADAFEHLAKLGEAFYDKLYPIRKVEPAGVGVAKYDDPEKAQPEKPEPGEDLLEGLGPRERALAAKLLEKQDRKTRRAKQKDRGTASVGP